jgi:hypothetical protein
MKVVLSAGSVPTKLIVWTPLLVTVKGMLMELKPLAEGVTRPVRHDLHALRVRSHAARAP